MTKSSGSTTINISKEQAVALRRAARNGEYHLMLGAGASLDSVDAGGARLPGSGELIKQLCSDFDVEAEDDDWLWRVYDRALEVADETAVYGWFRRKFWNVTPPYWMEYYARSPWSSVWTLNVDDSFEAAHRAIATETTRPVLSLNWDDDYRQGRQLNVVHLHGIVDRDEPRKLVFSLTEYAGSAAAKAAWPVNFRDSYGNSPFVILGARLRDEPDIEAVISRRRPSHAAPSFYVARTISSATRRDLLRWGLIPVEMTAEEFVSEWEELTGLDLEDPLDSELELGMRVGHQFRELKLADKSDKSRNHDFLGGDEPIWPDIVDGLAAEREWVTNAIMDCKQIGRSIASSSVLAYTGRRLSGRSTGLLLLGKHLRSNSWRTFLFREDSRVDIDAVLRFASDGRAIALLFDGLSPVADDIDRLITEARGAGLNVICVAVDDNDKEATILGRIHTGNLAHGRVAKINGRMSGTDANRFVDTLARVGRLGILESKSDRDRSAHFKNHDLFDSMSQLENAPGFGQRVGELLQGVSDQKKLGLVLLAAYASLTEGHLLVIDASRMVGLESDDLVRRVQSDPQLSALLLTDGKRVRTRHRWMALKPVIASLSPARAATIVRDGICSVSSRLSQQSLHERNPTSLLVGNFMSYRNLHKTFPDVDLEAWYESLLDVFGDWSARYWEQRAILARRSDVTQLAKAESFALRAAELVADTYSYTTLGTVLMEKAARAKVDVGQYYDRAISAFERASKLDYSGNSPVTWIAFLRYSLKVLHRFAGLVKDEPLSDANLQIVDRVKTDWVRIYMQLGVVRSAGDTVADELTRLHQKYEHLVQDISQLEKAEGMN